MDVEIYDECTFATDPQIASGNFPIPENVVSKQGRIKLHGSAELNFSYLRSYLVIDFHLFHRLRHYD